MKNLLRPLLVASVLWPTLSFAQSIFINSPSEGGTLRGPTVTIKMSVTDFDVRQDGSIRILIDGYWVEDTDRLRMTLPVPPGTHQLEVRLVDRRGRRIDSDAVKFTVSEDDD